MSLEYVRADRVVKPLITREGQKLCLLSVFATWCEGVLGACGVTIILPVGASRNGNGTPPRVTVGGTRAIITTNVVMILLVHSLLIVNVGMRKLPPRHAGEMVTPTKLDTSDEKA